MNEVKVKKKKIICYIVLERAQGPTLLDCNYADTCFTAARGSVLAGGCTQVPHRSTLYQQNAARFSPIGCRRHAAYFIPVGAAFYTTARVNAVRFSAVGVGIMLRILLLLLPPFTLRRGEMLPVFQPLA